VPRYSRGGEGGEYEGDDEEGWLGWFGRVVDDVNEKVFSWVEGKGKGRA
jgi:hypothetical protein